ncbi:dnaJ, partial [Symbiodinium sp. KB8]
MAQMPPPSLPFTEHTNSRIYVPLLLHAAGMVSPETRASWFADASIGDWRRRQFEAVSARTFLPVHDTVAAIAFVAQARGDDLRQSAPFQRLVEWTEGLLTFLLGQHGASILERDIAALRQPNAPPERAGSSARRQQRETACGSDLGISIVFCTQQREQASPHSIVVATRIAGREAEREGAQKVISARRGAHGEEEPRTLEGNEPALRLGRVTTPDIGPELGDARLAVTPARVSMEDVTASSVQCRCQGVPLFARFALMDGTPLPVFVPPEVCGLLSIPEALRPSSDTIVAAES